MKVMTERTLKRPEVLAPAGTLEKLKVAIRYGADAVYIGGNAYGLRSRAGNFTPEEMAEGVAFAREHNAKVYVAANMVTHETRKGQERFQRIARHRNFSCDCFRSSFNRNLCDRSTRFTYPFIDTSFSNQL